MQARLKPCIKRENINHRACTNEGCSLFLYRAQPVSEMERKARNRAAWLKPDGMKAQPVSEMERKARNRAAWPKPDGMKAQPSYSFLIYFLHHPDYRIQYYRHNAQQHNGHKEPIHLKDLT